MTTTGGQTATAAPAHWPYAHVSCAQWRPDHKRTISDWIAQHRVIPVFIIPDHRPASPAIGEPTPCPSKRGVGSLSEWLA